MGLSPDPGRDSHRIARLQSRGNRIVPVNPEPEHEILGERCYPRLTDSPTAPPLTWSTSSAAPTEPGAHVEEAIVIGARAAWTQLGVIDEPAAARARAAGLRVVMDAVRP